MRSLLPSRRLSRSGVLVLAGLALAAAGRPSDAPRRVFRIPVEGTIDLGLAPFVERVVAEATAEGAAVLLDVNTFGGRVDAAVLIRDALIDAKVPTIAFVDPRAISAGALISLACETIVMAPGGTIGAATPVTAGGSEEVTAADEKTVSYMRTEMRATAERRGRNPDIAAAMVDRDVEVEGLIEKGKVLTLTTGEALEHGIADHQAADLAAALAAVGLGEAEIVAREVNWAEQLARMVSNPMVSSLLLSLGFLGIMLELYQPGWGIPGTVGVICLTTFFFGHHVARLAGLEEILLFILGIGLLALELLVIPGFGVVGLAGIALALIAVVMSLVSLDLRISWELGFLQRAMSITSSAVLLTAVGGLAMLKLVPGTGLGRRLVLSRALDSGSGFESHGRTESERWPVGTEGVVESKLRPAGRARFPGGRLDVVSEGGWVEAGEKVRIVEWRAGTAVVRGVAAAAPEGPPEGGTA
jgi:membrane-bound serine protease (ClpP class)